MKTVQHEISLKLLDEKIEKSDLSFLKKFTGLPLVEINRSIDQSGVLLGELVNEKFYSGVNEIIVLLNKLKSNYQLYSNGNEINIKFLEDISIKVNNINLSDFR